MKYQGAFSRIVGFAGKRFLFSPPPPPSTFFCLRSNVRAITRLETLATQARYFLAMQGLDLLVLPLIVEDCLKLQHYCLEIIGNFHFRFINCNVWTMICFFSILTLTRTAKNIQQKKPCDGAYTVGRSIAEKINSADVFRFSPNYKNSQISR